MSRPMRNNHRNHLEKMPRHCDLPTMFRLVNRGQPPCREDLPKMCYLMDLWGLTMRARWCREWLLPPRQTREWEQRAESAVGRLAELQLAERR